MDVVLLASGSKKTVKNQEAFIGSASTLKMETDMQLPYHVS